MSNTKDNILIKNWIVGSDPECFLIHKETNEIISAIPYIPGNKYEPHQIPTLSEGHMIQTDNVMVEYCIPPTDNPVHLFNSFKDCVEWTESYLPHMYKVHIQASANLANKYLEDEAAKIFGCEPSFDAWRDGEQNESPKNESNLRVAGGHIHIGYDDPDMITSMKLIKALDIFLGIPSIILDKDKERKKMYGKAGEFRFKYYGLEYRTLSNFWLKDLESVKTIFIGIEEAVNFVNRGIIDRLSDTHQLQIQTCINTSDEQLALELIKVFKLEKVLESSNVFID